MSSDRGKCRKMYCYNCVSDCVYSVVMMSHSHVVVEINNMYPSTNGALFSGCRLCSANSHGDKGEESVLTGRIWVCI